MQRLHLLRLPRSTLETITAPGLESRTGGHSGISLWDSTEGYPPFAELILSVSSAKTRQNLSNSSPSSALLSPACLCSCGYSLPSCLPRLTRFTCSRCFHSWSSHQVVILFHMHWKPHWREGQVRVRLFGQKCHHCAVTYEDPQFNEEEMARIWKRLILDIREKCYGEDLDRSELSEMVWRPSLPHKRQYCEACHLGIHKTDDGWSKGAGHHGRPQAQGMPSSLVTQATARPSPLQLSWKQGPQPSAQFSDSTEGAYLACFLISIFILLIVAYCWAK